MTFGDEFVALWNGMEWKALIKSLPGGKLCSPSISRLMSSHVMSCHLTSPHNNKTQSSKQRIECHSRGMHLNSKDNNVDAYLSGAAGGSLVYGSSTELYPSG